MSLNARITHMPQRKVSIITPQLELDQEQKVVVLKNPNTAAASRAPNTEMVPCQETQTYLSSEEEGAEPV